MSDAVVLAVLSACERADAAALAGHLAPGAALLIDSGGDVVVSTQPVEGANLVPRLLSVTREAALTAQHVNGVLALVARRGDRVVAIVSLGFEGQLIDRVWVTLSPLKLRRWN